MKKRFALVLAAAFFAAAALLYLYFTGEGEGAGIPCMFHQITGFYCSGCGASRALRSILHLDFYQALRYNAIFTICLPLLAVYFSALGISYIRFGKDRISGKISISGVCDASHPAIHFSLNGISGQTFKIEESVVPNKNPSLLL